MPTTKELLETIREEQRIAAKNQLNFAAEISTFMNEQKGLNSRILGYLESDSKTNQKGVVEQVEINKSDIEKIKTERKITAGKVGVVLAILTAIGGFLLKLIGFFDK